MDGANDVIDRVEQAGVVHENLVDVAAAPGFAQALGVQAATDPGGSNTSDCGVDRGIATLDGKRCHRRWIEPAGGIGVDDH